MLLFLINLINIEIFRISFSFFYSFSFILRIRAISSSHVPQNSILFPTMTCKLPSELPATRVHPRIKMSEISADISAIFRVSGVNEAIFET